MKKLLLNLLTLLCVCVMALSAIACGNNPETHVIKDGDTKVVITVSSEYLEANQSATLVEYMEYLKEQGELEFEIASGMVTSINGIENPADWSSCWMLYTNDKELSNAEWGTAEYNGETYGSAIVGAETLIVKDGCSYIWLYQTF